MERQKCPNPRDQSQRTVQILFSRGPHSSCLHSTSNLQESDMNRYAKSWISHTNYYGTAKPWRGSRCGKPAGVASRFDHSVGPLL